MKAHYKVIEFLAAVFQFIGDVVNFLLTGKVFYVIAAWLLERKRSLLLNKLRDSHANHELRVALAEAAKTDKAVKIGFQSFKSNKQSRRNIEFVPSPAEPSPDLIQRDADARAYERELREFN